MAHFILRTELVLRNSSRIMERNIKNLPFYDLCILWPYRVRCYICHWTASFTIANPPVWLFFPNGKKAIRAPLFVFPPQHPSTWWRTLVNFSPDPGQLECASIYYLAASTVEHRRQLNLQWKCARCWVLWTSASQLLHYRNVMLLGAISGRMPHLPRTLWALFSIRSVLGRRRSFPFRKALEHACSEPPSLSLKICSIFAASLPRSGTLCQG